jgi:ubiquinol-cytochrome c reductase iron-sulfur subunit
LRLFGAGANLTFDPSRKLDMTIQETNAKQPDVSRRDFIYVATGAFAAVGTSAALWPLISQMGPDAQTLSVGAPIDVDLASLVPGGQMVVKWRGHPIFIVNRPPEALAGLQSPDLVALLADAGSNIRQQPGYAENWHRSSKPEYLVIVGVCTHLGCIPLYEPTKGAQGPAWPGGWFCPCHGSKYDLAGRVYKGMPAPYNLPVPPYSFISNTKVRIGQNPPGFSFGMDSVVQI